MSEGFDPTDTTETTLLTVEWFFGLNTTSVTKCKRVREAENSSTGPTQNSSKISNIENICQNKALTMDIHKLQIPQ